MLHIKGPAGVKAQKHYMASLPVLLPSLSVASIGQMQSHSLGQSSWIVAFHLAWEAQAPALHTQGLMGRCSGPGLLSPCFFAVGGFSLQGPLWISLSTPAVGSGSCLARAGFLSGGELAQLHSGRGEHSLLTPPWRPCCPALSQSRCSAGPGAPGEGRGGLGPALQFS